MLRNSLPLLELLDYFVHFLRHLCHHNFEFASDKFNGLFHDLGLHIFDERLVGHMQLSDSLLIHPIKLRVLLLSVPVIFFLRVE